MRGKPSVWYVDDIPGRLEDFRTKHGAVFDIQTFDRPGQVLEALASKKPDALLCDIFFYDTPDEAEDIEGKVQAKAQELRQFGAAIGADKP